MKLLEKIDKIIEIIKFVDSFMTNHPAVHDCLINLFHALIKLLP